MKAQPSENITFDATRVAEIPNVPEHKVIVLALYNASNAFSQMRYSMPTRKTVGDELEKEKPEAPPTEEQKELLKDIAHFVTLEAPALVLMADATSNCIRSLLTSLLLVKEEYVTHDRIHVAIQDVAKFGDELAKNLNSWFFEKLDYDRLVHYPEVRKLFQHFASNVYAARNELQVIIDWHNNYLVPLLEDTKDGSVH